MHSTIRWRMLGVTAEDRFNFDLNDQPLDVTTQVEPDEELPAVWFIAKLQQELSPSGDNELGLTLHELSTAERPWGLPYMEELEITIRA